MSLGELREAALHLSVYAGWGRGQSLDNATSRAAQKLGLRAAEFPPIRAADWDAAQRIQDGTEGFDKVMTFSGSPPVTPYLEAICNFVFGEMWGRPGLDERSRRWMTLVAVGEADSVVPLKSHVYAAMTSGNCTPAEMQEFVLQYGIQAGWPKGSVMQGCVSEMIEKVEKGLPWYS